VSFSATCYVGSSLDPWKSKTSATPRHSYATFHFGNKYEADAPADTGPKISSSRFRSPSYRPYIRALFRFRISWKVESYDRYVLEIGKSIHILFALAFFIYTGRTPLHKRAEIYGREEPHFIPFLFRRKWAPILFVGPSLFSKTIINYAPTEFLNLPRLGSEIYFALWSSDNGPFLFSVKLLQLLHVHVIPETLILSHSFRVQNPFFY